MTREVPRSGAFLSPKPLLQLILIPPPRPEKTWKDRADIPLVILWFVWSTDILLFIWVREWDIFRSTSHPSRFERKSYFISLPRKKEEDMKNLCSSIWFSPFMNFVALLFIFRIRTRKFFAPTPPRLSQILWSSPISETTSTFAPFRWIWISEILNKGPSVGYEITRL